MATLVPALLPTPASAETSITGTRTYANGVVLSDCVLVSGYHGSFTCTITPSPAQPGQGGAGVTGYYSSDGVSPNGYGRASGQLTWPGDTVTYSVKWCQYGVNYCGYGETEYLVGGCVQVNYQGTYLSLPFGSVPSGVCPSTTLNPDGSTPGPFTVSLQASKSWIAPGDVVALTATANLSVAGTGFVLRILDATTGATVCATSTTSSVACSITAQWPAHQYRAVIDSSPGGVQASSPAISAPSNYDLAATFGSNPNTPGEGDPVNVATGNFYDITADLTFPVRSGMPAFARTYNSEDTVAGPLGTGWSMSFQSGVALDAVGDALLRTEDGKTLRFSARSGGGFTSPPGYDGVLSRLGDGSWRVSGHHGGTVTFDAGGRLSGLTNPDGTVATLAYSGNRLSAVSSSTGSGLSFAYDTGSGRLSGVSSSDGRSVGFGYTNGRLTSATDVTGATSTYRYDPSGFLDKIVGPDGRTQVENSYDPLGRVTVQQTPQGQTLSYLYSDDASRTTTIAESSGASTTYAFDAQARLLSITDPTGHSVSRSVRPPDFRSISLESLTTSERAGVSF